MSDEPKTETKPKAAAAAVANAQPVAQLAPSRLPIVGSLAKEFGVTADQWRVLIDQIFPNARSVEAIGMALSYCRSRNLDVFKRPVHIVPMYSTVLKRMVETVWPGIAEIRTTAMRTGDYAGMSETEFGPMVKRPFKVEYTDQSGETLTRDKIIEFPEWAKVTVYRWSHGQKVAFPAVVYWEEAYATKGRSSDMPNEMWARRPRGQLEKCVEAAAIRKGFPEEVGNIYAAEEMEGRTIDAVAEPSRQIAPTPPEPPADEPENTVIEAPATKSEPDASLSTGAYIDHEAFGLALAGAHTLDALKAIWDEFNSPIDDERAVDMHSEALARVQREEATAAGQDDMFPGDRK